MTHSTCVDNIFRHFALIPRRSKNYTATHWGQNIFRHWLEREQISAKMVRCASFEKLDNAMPKSCMFVGKWCRCQSASSPRLHSWSEGFGEHHTVGTKDAHIFLYWKGFRPPWLHRQSPTMGAHRRASGPPSQSLAATPAGKSRVASHHMSRRTTQQTLNLTLWWLELTLVCREELGHHLLLPSGRQSLRRRRGATPRRHMRLSRDKVGEIRRKVKWASTYLSWSK